MDLRRFCHLKLRFRVDALDYSNVPATPDHNWEHSVYGKHEEDIAKNIPEPLGKRIVLRSHVKSTICFA